MWLSDFLEILTKENKTDVISRLSAVLAAFAKGFALFAFILAKSGFLVLKKLFFSTISLAIQFFAEGS